MQNSIISAVKILTAVIAVALSPAAFGVANYVYHERTGNDVTGGSPDCGGPLTYVHNLNPTAADLYPMRFKVEYQFFTDQLRVYYTTDGSAPSGAKGVASGTTQIANGTYLCIFTNGANVIDVGEAIIPAQPAGT